MIGLESLHEISFAVSRALATTVADSTEKDRILALPFGGLHVIFVGDLFQLPPIRRTPVYAREWKTEYANATKGKDIWNSINCYIRLVVNHRVKKECRIELLFAAALKLFRVGGSSKSMIDYLNSERLAMNEEECIARAHQV